MTRSFPFLLCVLTGALAAQSFEDEFRRGLLALSGNDLAQARQSLEGASRMQPGNAMVWAALAQTYLRAKDTALANEAAANASRLATADSPVQHALALYYSQTGEFAKAAFWPVTIAYYNDKTGTDALPIYRMSFKLYDNGITRDLTMDYGDFVLTGKLAKLDILKPETCENKPVR